MFPFPLKFAVILFKATRNFFFMEQMGVNTCIKVMKIILQGGGAKVNQDLRVIIFVKDDQAEPEGRVKLVISLNVLN